MKKYLLALLLALPSLAFAQVEAPPCYPTINGTHVGAPQIVFGKVAKHVFWACSHTSAPPKIWTFMCRHEDCTDAVVSGALNAIKNLATSGVASRIQEARRQYATHVTVDCKELLARPTIEQAEVKSWYMCSENSRYLNAFYDQWFPGVE